MQSIFRLPWCSDPIAPKAEHAALDKMHATPVVEIPVLNKLKRKRANSSDVTLARSHDYKKPRPDPRESSTLSPQAVQPQAQGPAVATAPRDSASSDSPQPPKADSGVGSPYTAKVMDISTDAPSLDAIVSAVPDALGLTPLQQVIENEFNMQILMKHNELRLIEQELAKCQVALEQLRRCELRPYPGSDSPSEAVSSGTGAAVLPPPGYSRPSRPAPHGVLDGPYSRHYRQWVLHDPQFDAVPLHMLQPEISGRPTRNSAAPVRRSVGQPFTFPGRQAEKLPSIPNYPSALAKERNLPNVLRRSTDGQLVKLICNNCERGNFSSIQGFLNHCRIAHKVDYKSHDAAAIDCGRPLDEAEAASLPPETQQTPAPKPTVSRTPTIAPTPQRSNSNLVHPLNSSGSPLNLSHSSKPAPARQPVRSLNPATFPSNSTPLKPSAQLPRLSAHFAKHNQGGDLAKAVADAKQKIDLGVEDDLSSPDISAQNSPLTAASGGRGPASLGINSSAVPRAPSQKGFRQLAQQSKARPSPLAPMEIKQESSEMHNIPGSPHSHASSTARTPSFDLSPHTADSNPGLVSDHEEDEDDHASSSENEEGLLTRPPSSRAAPALPGSHHQATCGAENLEIDVAIEDDEIDHDGLIIRRNSITDATTAAGRKFGGPTGKSGR